MNAHLPIVPIVLPMIAAPICMLLRRPVFVWSLATAVTSLVFAACVQILFQVMSSGPIIYTMGGWSAPIGIEYRIDLVNAYIMLLVSAIAALVMIYAPKSAAHELPPDRHNLFCAAFLMCLTGLLGITITGDAFNVYVFLEISSLASYAIISTGRDPRSLKAAYNYLIMGTIGATFILIAIGLMYMMTGTLNMADLAQRLKAVHDTRTIHVAFAFLSVGLTLKLALFPMHVWLPNAYTYAPSLVTAFVAATSTKVSIYVFLRFIFTIFGAEYAFATIHLNAILVPLAIAGIFVASTVAIYQSDLKRLLAYSSIAQIGYIMLGIGMGTVTGLTAGIAHIFNHALIKCALFMVVGCIALRLNSSRLEDMAGIGRRLPVTSFAFVLGGLALIGVPLTVGFISKWYLLLGALEHGWWPVAVLVLISSLLAAVYIWRFVEVAYFRSPPADAPPMVAPPLSMQIPIWLLLAATLFFGVQTDLTVGIAQRAALWLLAGGP
ncbi:MAG: monovalent cation/H+ antiporter subunit D family protein [Candidatus Latescibacterota bacterium]|jgi:multicomponent Na+:H+ antiporter subunit D